MYAHLAVPQQVALKDVFSQLAILFLKKIINIIDKLNKICAMMAKS